jgi:hypothetical protein
MDDPRTETTTQVVIDGQRYTLHPEQDLPDLKTRIEGAARRAPTFVEISGRRNTLYVLVTPLSTIAIVVEQHTSIQPELEPRTEIWDWEY